MNPELGKKIKQLRTNRNLTLDDLAKKIGTQKSYIWSVENGKIEKPSAESLAKIADALGTTVDALINEQDGSNKNQNKDVLYRNYSKLTEGDQKKIDDIIETFKKLQSQP
jgi:transcriptional regulator with XRE-family HTH domain